MESTSWSRCVRCEQGSHAYRTSIQGPLLHVNGRGLRSVRSTFWVVVRSPSMAAQCSRARGATVFGRRTIPLSTAPADEPGSGDEVLRVRKAPPPMNSAVSPAACKPPHGVSAPWRRPRARGLHERPRERRSWTRGIGQLIRATIHLGISRYRRNQRQGQLDTSADLPAHDPSPTENAMARETELAVRSAFGDLRPLDQAILRLTVHDGLNCRQAAESLGISHAAARQRRHEVLEGGSDPHKRSSRFSNRPAGGSCCRWRPRRLRPTRRGSRR